MGPRTSKTMGRGQGPSLRWEQTGSVSDQDSKGGHEYLGGAALRGLLLDKHRLASSFWNFLTTLNECPLQKPARLCRFFDQSRPYQQDSTPCRCMRMTSYPPVATPDVKLE